MLGRICDAEPDGNHIEKGRLGQCCALFSEVRARVKSQLVRANPHIGPIKQRTLNPPIRIRQDGLQQCWSGRGGVKFDLQSACRLAARGIEYMRCQSSHVDDIVHQEACFAPLVKNATEPVASTLKIQETRAMNVGDMARENSLEAGILRLGRTALANYALPAEVGLALHSLSENATLQVTAPDGRRWALRIHRDGYHSEAAIVSELEWLMDLRSSGIVATPIPVHGRDGKFVQSVVHEGLQRPRFAVLSRWEEGVEPQIGAHLSEAFERLGEITARMHRHARQWRRPVGFTRHVWDVEACLGEQNPRWGRWRDGVGVDARTADLIDRTVSVISRRLSVYGRGAERFGLIHADLRLANLLVDGNAIKVIDFDDCGFGWWMYDAATAVSFHEHQPDVPALIEAWKMGYRNVLPLPKEDESQIPSFIMMRRLLLVAWIGSHPEADIASSLGIGFTEQTTALCERFLSELA